MLRVKTSALRVAVWVAIWVAIGLPLTQITYQLFGWDGTLCGLIGIGVASLGAAKLDRWVASVVRAKG